MPKPPKEKSPFEVDPALLPKKIPIKMAKPTDLGVAKKANQAKEKELQALRSRIAYLEAEDKKAARDIETARLKAQQLLAARQGKDTPPGSRTTVTGGLSTLPSHSSSYAASVASSRPSTASRPGTAKKAKKGGKKTTKSAPRHADLAGAMATCGDDELLFPEESVLAMPGGSVRGSRAGPMPDLGDSEWEEHGPLGAGGGGAGRSSIVAASGWEGPGVSTSQVVGAAGWAEGAPRRSHEGGSAAAGTSQGPEGNRPGGSRSLFGANGVRASQDGGAGTCEVVGAAGWGAGDAQAPPPPATPPGGDGGGGGMWGDVWGEKHSGGGGVVVECGAGAWG